MPTNIYQGMEDLTWHCSNPRCTGFSNISTNLFRSQDLAELSHENPFSLLDPVESDSSSDGSSFHPQASSSPKRHKHRPSLKILQINCNSIRSSVRNALFRAHVDLHNPDIILGCESKLDQSVPTYECFPTHYTVYRKDRTKHGGGVFVAVRAELVSYHLTHLDSNCEALWVQIQTPDAQDITVCSFYRPPNETRDIFELLVPSMDNLFQRRQAKHPKIILAGDANLGDIDWSGDPPVTTDQRTAAKHTQLLDFVSKYGLSQHTMHATREASGKTLDIFLTSTPSAVANTNIATGMSDHNIIVTEVSTKPVKIRQQPRKVHLYKSMDLDGLQHDLRMASNEYWAWTVVLTLCL